MSARLRVAWFSPLAGGSVSRFATELLLEPLAAAVELTLFHLGEARVVETNSGSVQVEHYLNAVALDRRQPFDIFIYNLEDRKDCDFCRIHLALKPGIVWFHDFFLSTHGPEPILNSSWREIIARFADTGRSWPEREREYPSAGVLAEREAGMSFLPVFSNPRDHAEYLRLISLRLAGDLSRSLLLRHPVAGELFSHTPSRTAGTPLRIALSALPRIEAQVHQFFTALAEMEFSGTVSWPVPAGEVLRARELVSEFELDAIVSVLAGDGPSSWQKLVECCDVGVHLRFSAFGQPSPYLPMTLAAGLPALVTDFASGAEYPDAVVFKLSPGAAQVAEISAVLRLLHDSDASRWSANSRLYAQEMFHPSVVAQQLLQICHAEQPRLAALAGRWRSLEAAAAKELLRESRSLNDERSNAVDDLAGRILDPVYRELGWQEGL